MHRIYVDFNSMTMDPEGRIHIPTHIHPEYLTYLQPGLRLMLFDETLEVEAVAEHDGPEHEWWGRPDPTTYHDLPWP